VLFHLIGPASKVPTRADTGRPDAKGANPEVAKMSRREREEMERRAKEEKRANIWTPRDEDELNRAKRALGKVHVKHPGRAGMEADYKAMLQRKTNIQAKKDIMATRHALAVKSRDAPSKIEVLQSYFKVKPDKDYEQLAGILGTANAAVMVKLRHVLNKLEFASLNKLRDTIAPNRENKGKDITRVPKYITNRIIEILIEKDVVVFPLFTSDGFTIGHRQGIDRFVSVKLHYARVVSLYVCPDKLSNSVYPTHFEKDKDDELVELLGNSDNCKTPYGEYLLKPLLNEAQRGFTPMPNFRNVACQEDRERTVRTSWTSYSENRLLRNPGEMILTKASRRAKKIEQEQASKRRRAKSSPSICEENDDEQVAWSGSMKAHLARARNKRRFRNSARGGHKDELESMENHIPIDYKRRSPSTRGRVTFSTSQENTRTQASGRNEQLNGAQGSYTGTDDVRGDNNSQGSSRGRGASGSDHSGSHHHQARTQRNAPERPAPANASSRQRRRERRATTADTDGNHDTSAEQQAYAAALEVRKADAKSEALKHLKRDHTAFYLSRETPGRRFMLTRSENNIPGLCSFRDFKSLLLILGHISNTHGVNLDPTECTGLLTGQHVDEDAKNIFEEMGPGNPSCTKNHEKFKGYLRVTHLKYTCIPLTAISALTNLLYLFTDVPTGMVDPFVVISMSAYYHGMMNYGENFEAAITAAAEARDKMPTLVNPEHVLLATMAHYIISSITVTLISSPKRDILGHTIPMFFLVVTVTIWILLSSVGDALTSCWTSIAKLVVAHKIRAEVREVVEHERDLSIDLVSYSETLSSEQPPTATAEHTKGNFEYQLDSRDVADGQFGLLYPGTMVDLAYSRSPIRHRAHVRSGLSVLIAQPPLASTTRTLCLDRATTASIVPHAARSVNDMLINVSNSYVHRTRHINTLGGIGEIDIDHVIFKLARLSKHASYNSLVDLNRQRTQIAPSL